MPENDLPERTKRIMAISEGLAEARAQRDGAALLACDFMLTGEHERARRQVERYQRAKERIARLMAELEESHPDHVQLRRQAAERARHPESTGADADDCGVEHGGECGDFHE